MKKTQSFTNARLNAVQALYAIEMNEEPVQNVIFQFLNGQIGTKIIDENEKGQETFIPLSDMDTALFSNLVQEASKRKQEIKDIIMQSLSKDWDKDRIELLLQCILTVGICEFFVNPTLDAPIIINEYVDIARSFYDGPEVKLVNAVLDNFSKKIR